MRYAMCCVTLLGLWPLVAVAGSAGGRITFEGEVVAPTCSTVTSVVRPVIGSGTGMIDARVCGYWRQGRFVPGARYQVRTRLVTTRHWLPQARILRLLGRSDAAARRHVKLVTRNYL